MAKEEKTKLEQAEEHLRNFWLEKSKTPVIKARHAELFVEPKVFVGGEVNPEIMKLAIKEYLSKVGVDDIARGRVVITSDMIRINDEQGRLLAEVRSKRMIDSMINKITDHLGKQLAAKQSKDGDPYVAPKEGAYAFGDIKGALVEFMTDMQKNDSKNLVRDAIILLKSNSHAPIEVRSAPIVKPVTIKKEIPHKK